MIVAALLGARYLYAGAKKIVQSQEQLACWGCDRRR